MSGLAVKRGKYGRSKVKAFYVFTQYSQRWLSARQLCLLAGVPYRSLGRHLSRWLEFGYVERRYNLTQPQGGGTYEYRALDKALTWLSLAEAELPGYNTFINALIDWQTSLKPYYNSFVSLGFVEFVKALDNSIRSGSVCLS